MATTQLGGSGVDNLRYVLIEQIVNSNGSITVHGVHEYLFGPTVVGDVYLATSSCSVASAAPPPDTTVPNVTIEVGSASPGTTSSSPVVFDVRFSEAGHRLRGRGRRHPVRHSQAEFSCPGD